MCCIRKRIVSRSVLYQTVLYKGVCCIRKCVALGSVLYK
uniref:Uncharacterized protein n=1 Tax=Anguilla anguilla TaxID=7936 RepID=A0A0E9TLQ5_ANGAN